MRNWAKWLLIPAAGALWGLLYEAFKETLWSAVTDWIIKQLGFSAGAEMIADLGGIAVPAVVASGLVYGAYLLGAYIERGKTQPFASAVPSRSAVPKIEICFEKGAPYEVIEATHGRVKSTVRIGLKNIGGVTLANCKVSIEKIVPEPSIPGGLPLLLDGAGFTLRYDDPEKHVEIATHWNHVDKYRFSLPLHGGLWTTTEYIEDQPERTILVRVEASGYQRSASFRISVDDSKALHLAFLGYVS